LRSAASALTPAAGPVAAADSWATDALAASPFALLDAHSSLRLVTDAVHEDDALCLALVCRALRDALRARFPACPRTGGRAVASLAERVTADGVLDLSHEPTGGSNSDSGEDDYYLRGLTALPEGFGRLACLPAPGLRMLDLSFNRGLRALPAGLCALAGLEELDLRNCGLVTLPEGIGALAGLRKFDLGDKEGLTALPAGLCGPGLITQWVPGVPGDPSHPLPDPGSPLQTH
jgi:hypothetical protein